MAQRPLVVHLIYRLDFGGLETLLAECINRMPSDRYRHAIVCLTGFTDFAKVITAPGVEIYALEKPPGLAPQIHLKLWRLLRRLRPAILHGYNLTAVEYAFTAALAGVPVRIHAEHGRDAEDPQGTNKKYRFLRRALTPFIDTYVTVSQDLQQWLQDFIGVPAHKSRFIPNGVDTDRFMPRIAEAVIPSVDKQWSQGCFVIGTVGRAHNVKNHHGLIDAFLCLRNLLGEEEASRLRLVIVGDGPLLPSIKQRVSEQHLDDVVWLPGSRTDIANIMRTFSVFTLPSLAEGTPVTILEAMATGLPIVATKVGGIPEVVEHGVHGLLVPPQDANALAQALLSYFRNLELMHTHGMAGRAAVERQSSVKAMVASYLELYDALRHKKNHIMGSVKPCAE